MIKILMREDLKDTIPVGKMAAQAAHALTSGFLSLFEKKYGKFGDYLSLKETNENFAIELIKNNIKIELGTFLEEDIEDIKNNNKNTFIVTDLGRTCFSEPTITSIAIFPEFCEFDLFMDCFSALNKPLETKQIIVLDTSNDWSNEDILMNASLISLRSIADLIDNDSFGFFIDLNKNLAFNNWISNSFAKIVVSSKKKNLETSFNTLPINYKYSSIVKNNSLEEIGFYIGADFLENIEIVYKKNSFKLK